MDKAVRVRVQGSLSECLKMSGKLGVHQQQVVAEPDLLDTSCRYCLKTEDAGSLVAPCSCSGSQKFVHQECLSTWLLRRSECCSVSPTDAMAPQDPLFGVHQCELCLQPIQGGWRRSLKPRVYWREGVSPCIRRFMYIMCTFNILCFILSLVRLVLYWGEPVNKQVLTEAIADWLDVVLVLVSISVVVALLWIDRCPLMQIRCRQWEWSCEQGDDDVALIHHV